MSRSGPSLADRFLGGALLRGATVLVVAQVSVFLLAFGVLGGPAWVRAHLALTPALGLGPEPWQLVTSAFVHLTFWRLFSSLVGILFMVNYIERRRGTRPMLVVFGGAQLAGALGFAIAGRLLGSGGILDGCVPGVIGATAAFAVYYDREVVSLFGALQMRGRTLGLLVLGLSALTDLLNLDVPMLSATAAAAATGWALAGGKGGSIFDGLRDAWDRVRLARLRRRYKVIPGGKVPERWVN